jgi:LysR family glycine cleavage system transcriptional activator
MWLPSLRALEAFLAVARAGSLAAGAAQLNLSTPALSRRIQQLEKDLGATLFERGPRGVALTETGAFLLAETAAPLEQVRRAATAVRARGREAVRLTTIPAFATRWLLPRLPRFAALHPDIEVDLQTGTAFADLQAEDFDLAIRLAKPGAAGVSGEPLLQIHLLPVWAPGARLAIREPADLADHALLGPDHRPEFWREWLAAHGLPSLGSQVRPIDSLLLYELTMSGAGVAIGIEPLVTHLLVDGRLIGLSGHRLASARAFYLLARRGAETRRPVRLFRAWLQAEAARSSLAPTASLPAAIAMAGRGAGPLI